MGFFKYPYTDLNELNLDWVIAKIKYIEQAKNIIYDNSGTQLISNNVQDALTELYTLISTQGVTSFNNRVGDVMPEAGDYNASQVTYDNTNTGYTATDVQAAIDEADAKIEAVSQTVPVTYVETFNSRSGAVTPAAGDYDGTQVTYDNSNSGLAATDLQGAVDELAAAPEGVTFFNNRTGAVVPLASDYTAAQVDFDDSVAQTGSSNVQGALEYVATRGASAQYTTYDNTQSGLTATNVQDAIDEVANDVLSSGVASFNGRTGAVNPQSGDYDLTELGDVAISTPAQDEVLKYDAVSQKWVNGAGGGGGASTLAGLTDVSLTSPVSGDQLTYDGSDWVNTAAPSIPTVLDDLSDVTLSTPLSGQVLAYNGSGWVNKSIAGYSFIENVTLANTETTETWATRLNHLANAVVTYCQSLANDEIAMLSFMTQNVESSSAVQPMRVLDNSVTEFTQRFQRNLVGPSQGQLFFFMMSTTAANNVYRECTFTTAPNISVTDNSSVIRNQVLNINLAKFKKIGG